MILLKRHHQCPEPSAHYRPTRRRRLNDSSATSAQMPLSSSANSQASEPRPVSYILPNTSCELSKTTCPIFQSPCVPPNITFPTSFIRKRQSCTSRACRPTVGISSLPTELLLKILSYLPLAENLRVAQTCRKLHTLSQDASLHKHLDLSGLRIRYTPPSIIARLTTAHSLTITPRSPTPAPVKAFPFAMTSPASSTEHDPTIHYSFSYITTSLNLTSLTLRALPRACIPQLHALFSRLQTQKLQHVDLARTYVPNHLLSLIISRYGGTLVSLDLEFAAITDHALEILSHPNVVPRLRELGLAGCLNLSERGLKRFLCGGGGGTLGVGAGVEALDLRWGMDVSVEWVEGWLQRRQAPSETVETITGRVDLRGCERVATSGVEVLRRKWPGVEVRFTSKKDEAGKTARGKEHGFFEKKSKTKSHEASVPAEIGKRFLWDLGPIPNPHRGAFMG